MWEDGYKHKGLRRLLIKKLIEKGIIDKKVLDVMGLIPRHVFLDNVFLEQSYQDIAFPIGEGQTISQPYTVAFQSQLLAIAKGDKVLEVGTGSGYQACVLIALGAKLFTIERNKTLHEKSKGVLKKLGYEASFICGDGTQGYSLHAPYHKIIVTAGAPIVPPKLIEQLCAGGVLVIPVGNESKQTMLKITKMANGSTTEERYENFRFVPLIGADGWKK